MSRRAVAPYLRRYRNLGLSVNDVEVEAYKRRALIDGHQHVTDWLRWLASRRVGKDLTAQVEQELRKAEERARGIAGHGLGST